MKIVQTEQLDPPLNEPTRVMNKNEEAEETDALTEMKRDNRCLSLLCNINVQTGIVMAEKTGTDMTSEPYEPKSNMKNKFIVAP